MPRRERPRRRLVVAQRVLQRDRLPQRAHRRCGLAGARGKLAGEQPIGHGEDRLGRVDRPEHLLVRDRPQQRHERLVLRARLVELPRRRERHAAREPMRSGQELQILGRRRLREHLLPVSEADQRKPGRRPVVVDAGHLRFHRAQHLGGQAGGRLPRRADRLRGSSFHGCRGPEELEIVRDIHHRVEALGLRPFEVRPVGGDGPAVRLGSFLVAAGAHVDVGGHVHEMPRTGLERCEAPRRIERLLRVRRGFDRVDVEMVGPRVIGPPREHFLERGDDLGGPRLRLLILRPEVPRAKVHEGLGEQHRRIVVGRVLARQLPHRVGVTLVQRGAVGPWRVDVAARHGRDVVLLCRLPDGQLRLLHHLPGQLLALGVGGKVDVGPERERDAPQAHRALGVDLRAALEGADRLFVIEGIGEAQALIEILLRFRRRPDGALVGAQIIEERRGGLRGAKEQRSQDFRHIRVSPSRGARPRCAFHTSGRDRGR